MSKTTLSWVNEDDNSVNAIWLDAVLSENYSRSATVTEFVIEGGAVISDHVSPNQTTVSLEVFISDSPVVAPQSHVRGGVTARTGSKALTMRPVLRSGNKTEKVSQPGPVVGLPSVRLIRANKELARGPIARRANVLQFTGRLERVANVFDVLNELLENGTTCKISMKVGTFEELLITGLEAPRDATSGTGLSFTVDFVQVTRVSSETTKGTRKPKPKKPRNDPSTQAGAKETEETSEERSASLLSAILG